MIIYYHIIYLYHMIYISDLLTPPYLTRVQKLKFIPTVVTLPLGKANGPIQHGSFAHQDFRPDTHDCINVLVDILKSQRFLRLTVCLMSHISCLTSHISCLISHVSCLISHVSRLISHVSCRMSQTYCMNRR